MREDALRKAAAGKGPSVGEGGRLGKALIRELLSRAVVEDEVMTRPFPAAPEPTAPLFDESVTPAFDKGSGKTKHKPPSEKSAKARDLLDKIDTLSAKSKKPPKSADGKKPFTLLEYLESQEGKVSDTGPVQETSSEDVLAELEARIEDEEGPAPSHSFGAPAAKKKPSLDRMPVQETQTFLTLSQLTESLCAVTKSHLDESVAMRTMLEDLEMPDAWDNPDPQAQAHIKRVASAEEISFEGYLEDIEALLLETYEHYRNVPQAFDTPVDPAKSDILGPGGKTLETRRADRKASAKLRMQSDSGPVPPSPPSRPRGHIVPSGPVAFTNAPVVPQQPAAQSPQSWQPDPFAVDPFATQPPPGGAAAGGAVAGNDPFAVDPYTGQSMKGKDPFAVDPFNPYGDSAPEPAGPPASAPAGAANDPFMNPYGSPGGPPAGSPFYSNAPAASAPPPGGFGGGFPGVGTPPPATFRGPGQPPQTSPFAAQNKAKESLGFDPFADPGDSQDPFSWPSRPPQALVDAQEKADADLERFDPFGPDASAIPGQLPGQGVPATNPFGPGNMFGSNIPGVTPPIASHKSPIYIQDSDEFQQGRPKITASDTKRAFENALVVAGLRGMIEYQRPTPGHGASHPVLLIYDATTRMFKAPLNPRMSVGDRFQLKDGRIFRVTGCRIHSVDNVPCYQEVDAKPLGQLNMPLRDSWEGPD